MKELVVLSGKGGTGKTSLTASFAVLADSVVLADCDVDAADLHLVLQPDIQLRERFVSGCEARIRTADCTRCGLCVELCRFEAIRDFQVEPTACEGCGVCAEWCPAGAIDLRPRDCGEWYVSTTRCGDMVHARMSAGAENSGRLVSLVRQEARRLAEQEGADVLLVDGPPGIGCPVIASLTGADAVLVVTEPTLSGEHDLRRVLELVAHFGLSAQICINKWDINHIMSDRIESLGREMGAECIGRIPYDRAFTAAQIHGRALVEEENAPAARAVQALWRTICSRK